MISVLKASALIVLLNFGAYGSAPQATSRIERIAFDSDRSGTPEIYVIDVDGTNLRQLTHVHRVGVASRVPDWSPDQSAIVFASNRSGRLADLYIFDVGDSSVRQLTNTPLISESNPAWAPDGRHIIYSAQRYALASVNIVPQVQEAAQIWIIAIDGSDVRPLTSGSSRNIRPSWSPDGAAILFSSDRHVPVNPHFFGRDDGDLEVYRMGVDGSNIRRMTHFEGTALGAKWSPNNRQIVFHGFQANGASDILIMNADGTKTRNLTRGHFSAGRPTWSLDGRDVAFNSEGAIYIMRAHGSDPRLVTKNGRHPSWR